MGDAEPGRKAVRPRRRFGGRRGAGRQRREADRAPLDVGRGDEEYERGTTNRRRIFGLMRIASPASLPGSRRAGVPVTRYGELFVSLQRSPVRWFSIIRTIGPSLQTQVPFRRLQPLGPFRAGNVGLKLAEKAVRRSYVSACTR